ncbi:hypothetical protein [Chryseobacterium oryctis]|uniref:Uncharacterized protein n=1 Tax=Chryseobacterium oryctis TaxID=2952618 RepID=A0ABT3HNF0_9FLAO|nr:hypothetical protein [Chryseobacterium oryctis]MCW3161296.1 hypothetical protein [Chryseobacterium oryctis]
MKKILFLFLLQIGAICLAQVGVGTPNPNSKSILDVMSTTKGVLMPRMSQVQRDSIVLDKSDVNVDGLLVYNTDTGCYNYWNNAQGKWKGLGPAECEPLIFADFTIDCNQFPAADTNTYSAGSSVAGNTINVSVNVYEAGPYYITITSNNGVSYSATGTFTTTGLQTVTVANATGAPSSLPINFAVKINGITLCRYTKDGTGGFSYNYNCSAAKVSPAMVQGIYGSGTVRVPITITGTGNIPPIYQTINGVTYSFAGLTGATSAVQEIVIAYSGTPGTSSSTLPINNSNGTVCNIEISTNRVNATYTCTRSATVFGDYVALTKLDPSKNYIEAELNVTTPGYVNISTEDKNGMVFTFNDNVTNTGVVKVKLLPGNSTTKLLGVGIDATGSTPNTSEEVSKGAKGDNDQVGEYSIRNEITKENLCTATIGVTPLWVAGKPLEMQSSGDNASSFYWLKNGAKFATDGKMKDRMPTDGRIVVDFVNLRNFGLSLTATFWGAYIKNVSGANIDQYKFKANGTADANVYDYAGLNLANGARLGSMDPYLKSFNDDPTPNSLGSGAHGAGFEGLIPPFNFEESTNTGLNIRIGNYWYKYRLMWISVPESSQHLGVQTTTHLVLYGIYENEPIDIYDEGIHYWPTGGASAEIKNPKSYWP